jgi:hypothetical protein
MYAAQPASWVESLREEMSISSDIPSADQQVERHGVIPLAVQPPIAASPSAVTHPSEATRRRRPGFAWIGLGAVCILAVAILFIAGHRPGASRLAGQLARPSTSAPARPVPSPAVVPIVPIVPPAVNILIGPDQARQSNAARPFDETPLAMSPFRYVGSPEDRDRAEICLAAAQLYEAGDNPEGERAVAQVVINRLRHPAFPKTVCGVVFQGSERPTGCQFTFTCDGSLARIPSTEAWKRARAIAAAVLSGAIDSAVGSATHYHADWVVPYWRDSLAKIAAVHTHIFYRWAGWWGTPAAFVGRNMAAEQVDPHLLAALGMPSPPPDMPDLSQRTLAPANAPLPDLPIKGVALADLKGARVLVAEDIKARFVLLLDPAAYPGSYAIAANAICRNRPSCMVVGWTEAAVAPSALPAPPASAAAMAFLYRKGIYSTKSSAEEFYWNCRQIPRADRKQCLPDTAPSSPLAVTK